jgi:hypothetical protein
MTLRAAEFHYLVILKRPVMYRNWSSMDIFRSKKQLLMNHHSTNEQIRIHGTEMAYHEHTLVYMGFPASKGFFRDDHILAKEPLKEESF